MPPTSFPLVPSEQRISPKNLMTAIISADCSSSATCDTISVASKSSVLSEDSSDDIHMMLDSLSSSSDSEDIGPHVSSPPRPVAFACNPHGPTLVRPTPGISQAFPGAKLRNGTLPINDPTVPFSIDTDLFQGKVLIMFKNLPSTPAALFQGKRRQAWFVIQGQFKRPVAFADMVMGCQFSRRLNVPFNLPFLSTAMSWLLERTGGGQIDALSDTPHLLTPLMAAAQAVNVSRQGEQPDMLQCTEDMRLHDPCLCRRDGSPLTAGQRRSLFKRPAGRAGHVFDTEHVYTFDLYDHSMDWHSFKLLLPLLHLDMVRVLDGQPAGIMVKDLATGQHLMHLEVWHQMMLKYYLAQP